MSYAIIRTGGKQYRVAPGDVIRVEKLTADPGSQVEFTEVLMTSDQDAVRVGTPMVAGARATYAVTPAAAPYRKQPGRWSSTMPTDCMKA